MSEVKSAIKRMSVYYLLLAINIIPWANIIADTNAEIAGRLNISIGTVKRRIRHLMEKQALRRAQDLRPKRGLPES